MQEKFFNKLVKKNYNNELEKVLEEKVFDENAKNILLSILYKIETAYKDYNNVKRDVQTKDEYINKIINIIQNDCERLVVLKQGEDDILENRTFIVNKEKREIISYPIERKLLYAISKINKKDIIINDKYQFMDKMLSDAINIGNNIDTVEPLRDFNGWSWTTVSREIESLEYNLLYQNIRILIGNKFLLKLVENKNNRKDYLQLLEEKLKSKMRSTKRLIFYGFFKKNISIVRNKI